MQQEQAYLLGVDVLLILGGVGGVAGLALVLRNLVFFISSKLKRKSKVNN